MEKPWPVNHIFRGTFKTSQLGHVTSLSIHPSGKLALSVGTDKTLRTWNLVEGRSAFIKNLKQNAHIVKWSPSGEKYVVVVTNKVDVYKLETASVSGAITTEKRISSVRFITDSVLAIAGDDEVIRLYDCDSQKCLCEFKAHENRSAGSDQSRRGRFIPSSLDAINRPTRALPSTPVLCHCERRKWSQRNSGSSQLTVVKTPRMGLDWIGFGYAALVTSGGIIGYAKAAVSHILVPEPGVLIISVLLLTSKQFASGTLTGVMGMRFYNSGKVMPAGLIAGARKPENAAA
ncbi:p21-activated protein kinase-interacting protein 1-like protein [Chelonia mydas]|uniref:p21-activated protein kinase-interacting protein 1-like protein n=1 Tax=Chelonia mydas TaxID=8469 RepID=M7BR67_CHEMY|nr:p21-activated protein kinase-interacting protein 1-like protein [Chelonia mydas]